MIHGRIYLTEVMMDIERLKELVQAEDSDLWDYKVELIGLLDEAIARQSVKSEEVADVGGEKEKRNAGEWERMVDAYGTLEGWLCPCGFSSAGAWSYCPSCGSEMYGGEKK